MIERGFAIVGAPEALKHRICDQQIATLPARFR